MKLKINFNEVEIVIPAFSFQPPLWLVLFVVSFLSAAAYIFSSTRNIVVAYNDARAHMNMARLVFDNLKPGLVQIGSVWLPLDHILKLVFVWNDTLWQSGFAGSFWSMVSYILTSYVVYRLTLLIARDKWAAFLAMILFATNLNVLYMQTTPMTELLLLFFFTAATYFFYLWTKSKKVTSLIFTALFVFLATLTRYDGWFLFLLILSVIVFTNIKEKLKEYRKFSLSSFGKIVSSIFGGKTLFFATLGGFGIALWLIWNLLIYGDALYFALGPYSAKVQQNKIAQAGSLLTKNNFPLSLKAYWLAMVDNIGLTLMILAIAGLANYIYKNKFSNQAQALYTLLSPLFFHVLSLYIGFSILVVPELGTSFTSGARASWFNVRYGLMIIPAVAVFSGYLVRKNIRLKILIIFLILLQGYLFWSQKNIITITDGVIGTSSLDVVDVRDWLVQNAKEKDGLILTSISYNNALAFSTGMHLKRFIHEGTGKYWKESLDNPSKYAKWIVMANGDVGDQVYDELVKKKNPYFIHDYELKMRGKHTDIYGKKDSRLASKNTQNVQGLYVKIGEMERFIGVNSYDLVYLDEKEMEEIVRLAKDNGVKVIRFWGFGEGIPTGFQPDAGKFNDETFDKLAYVLAVLDVYDIKAIVTLGNYWKDYGGVPMYLQWDGLPNQTPEDWDKFFTNKFVKLRYRTFIEKILNYESKYSGKKLKDDPAVLAWELMNEPRSSTAEKSGVVLEWLTEMAKLVKSIDKNHLVLAGTEGFTELYNAGGYGPSFEQVAALPEIDAATAHYYSEWNSKNIDLTDLIVDWANQAQIVGKPFIFEEIGFDKRSEENDGVDRSVSYENMFKFVRELNESDQLDVDGLLLWNWALKLDENYGISPTNPKDRDILKSIQFFSFTL